MTNEVNSQSNKPNYLAYGVGGAAVGGAAGAVAKKVAPVKYELKPDTFDATKGKDKIVADAVETAVKTGDDDVAVIEKVFKNETATKMVKGEDVGEAKLPDDIKQADVDKAKTAYTDAKAELTKNLADGKKAEEIVDMDVIAQAKKTAASKTEGLASVIEDKKLDLSKVKAVFADSVKEVKEGAEGITAEALKTAQDTVGKLTEFAKSAVKETRSMPKWVAIGAAAGAAIGAGLLAKSGGKKEEKTEEEPKA